MGQTQRICNMAASLIRSYVLTFYGQSHCTLTRDNMIIRITTTLENIPLGILRAVDYLKHRIYLCRRVQSQNFEYLL